MDRYQHHWLKLAQEARDNASRLGDRISQQRLIAVAQKYEILARGCGADVADPAPARETTAA